MKCLRVASGCLSLSLCHMTDAEVMAVGPNCMCDLAKGHYFLLPSSPVRLLADAQHASFAIAGQRFAPHGQAACLCYITIESRNLQQISSSEEPAARTHGERHQQR